MPKISTKRALTDFCLTHIATQLHQIKSLAPKDKIFLKAIKNTNTKLNKKGVASFNHADDAHAIECIVLCEPLFISGIHKSKNGLPLPVFKKNIGKLYKSTVHSLLIRLGRVNHNHIEIHANYVTTLPSQIKHYRSVLNTLK